MDYRKINSHIVLLGIVIVVGLLAAIIVRLSMLESGADKGTANLVFFLVLGVCAVIYLIIMSVLSRSVIPWTMKRLPAPKRKVVDTIENQKIVSGEEPKEQSVAGTDDEWICDDVLPELGDRINDPGEEEILEDEPEPIPTQPQPVVINWKELREKELQAKFNIFIEYTHYALGPYVNEVELARLDEFIELYVHNVELPQDITTITPERLKNPDLFHFGWNMAHYFEREKKDVVPWLQKIFTPLADLEYSYIKGKLHDLQTRKYIIPNIDDIPKYMVEKRA